MKRCVFVVIPILAITFLMTDGRAQPTDSTIETQVLRVFATTRSGYYHKPWKSPDFRHVKGSAFFFKDDELFPGERGLILTNAHAVSMGQSIKVSNGREKQRYDVNLLGVCDSADFAVVKMEADQLELYERRNGKVVPLELGNSDQLRVGHKVLGWGYPLGGEGISKSEEGEISRIEVNRYAYSGDRWLMVQASMQQNRGNSGGPVLKDGKVVGISFQGIRTSDRINYFIPINLVKRLVPALGDQARIPQWHYLAQSMFPRLKDYYDLDADHGGILVDYVIPGGGPHAFGLRDGDILLEMDGHEIDNFGDIFFEEIGQRVYYGEILNRKLVGDPLTVKVIRAGEVKEITGVVGEGLPELVPRIFSAPNYFIFGGIGFVELTLNCIDNLGKAGEPFRAKFASEFPEKPYQKVVIISEIFPEYGLVDTTPFLKKVEKIDGEDVLNIIDLYEKIRSLQKQGKKKVALEVAGRLVLPLDIKGAEELDKDIKERYGILYMKTPGGFRK
ncbi:MAG: trypsin-like peptidase domain-containing protein [Desulfomonilaceae bacterium]|nr:trypsin-like peptidase domain-containing protein [Desulfomonilaceae bacterium]